MIDQLHFEAEKINELGLFYKSLIFLSLIWFILGYNKYRQEKDIFKALGFLISKPVLLISLALFVFFYIFQILILVLTKIKFF